MPFDLNTRRTQLQQQLALIDVLLRGSIYSTTVSANEMSALDYSSRASLRYREPRVFTYEFEASSPNRQEDSLHHLISGLTDDELDTVLHDIHALIASHLMCRPMPSQDTEMKSMTEKMTRQQEDNVSSVVLKQTKKKKKLEVDLDLD